MNLHSNKTNMQLMDIGLLAVLVFSQCFWNGEIELDFL